MLFRSVCIVPLVMMLVVGCGGRTELGEPEDLDSSLPVEDAAQDGISTIDVTLPDVIDEIIVEDAPTIDVIEIDVGPPPPQCTDDCTTNHECAITCPSIEHGRYCCDVPTGTCFAISGHHCPQSIPDAGFD